jgi:hypothetical protein
LGGVPLAAFVLLETDEVVIYRFGPNENDMGLIQLDKVNQMFTELKPITNPTYSSKFYFDRAAYRLVKCFFREGAIFPDRTTFES